MPKLLGQISGMPQMASAFIGWTIPLRLIKISQTVVDGFVETVNTTVNISGTWQPLSAEEIKLKEDGQRSWEWIDLHVVGKTLLFETNDRIEYAGLRYKIMAVKDYTLNNYSEYHLIRDYQDE